MSKVRARSVTARPLTRRELTVEGNDVALTAALITVKARPSAANHRKVAAQYLRHGIKDVAHEHFTAALKLDSRDAASWDGLARIWRDWGFPNLALPDASRAVYYAPDSPVVYNTLGTILQALGRRAEARSQYEKALAVDATAAYALTNLCYGWALEGKADKAAGACRQALRLKPDMEAARNNLAVAYEVSGDSTAALDVLAESGDAARTQYNAGILHLAARRFPEALQAFDKALALRPPFAAAELMARQARRQLQEGTAR
jgi:Flp pilus assembly protein TadD